MFKVSSAASAAKLYDRARVLPNIGCSKMSGLPFFHLGVRAFLSPRLQSPIHLLESPLGISIQARAEQPDQDSAASTTGETRLALPPLGWITI